MTTFDNDEFTRLVVRKIEELGTLDVVLSNPEASSVFPAAVVSTPLTRVLKSWENKPAEIAISVPIEIWANKKYDAIGFMDDVEAKLTELSMLRGSTVLDAYDDITKKYRYVANYEVVYNALHNSLENRR
jgi:hypothetical protein